MTKIAAAIAIGLGLVVSASGLAPDDIVKQVGQLELQGQFRLAASALANALTEKFLSAAQRQQLEFELARLDRIRKDFMLTKAALFAGLKRSVKGLTMAEFDRWIAEGRFDSREIDGERRFMNSSVSNLFFRCPDLEARRIKPRNTAPFEKSVLAACQSIKQVALAEKKSYVLPKRFHVTMTITAKVDAAPAGEVIHVWLPIPRWYPFQTDFELRSASPPVKEVNGRDSVIRAAYLEAGARQGKSTRFRVEYDYTTYGVWFAVKPEDVHSCDPTDPKLAPFLREAPHVVFTPELRALSRQIAGNETNPAWVAKKWFDWIASHIQYSYAIEYSTIRNISEYCRSHGYGDCGQEALLFITLCRMNGIPARWQSGWNTFPGGKSIHDWAEIYLEPYGWLPVDPYRGIWAMRYTRTLTAEQQREIRDFYFGGLDQWRMAANSDHCQSLSPPKNSLRSDDVDFQRGELEWGNHNIYFDQYLWKLDVKEVKLPRVK